MRLFNRPVLASLFFAGWLVSATSAGPFSSFYVFGDSLSDVGNLSGTTGGLFPGPSYFEGRVSNGPVFVESLSIELGLGPSTPSYSGGNNFAFGGARTTGTGGIAGLVVQDVDEQVTSFLSSRAADPAALFMVFAGANDLVAGLTNLDTPVDQLATDIGRLHDAGARRFFVPNLPRLGLTPRYNGDAGQSAMMNDRTDTFNDLLTAMLHDLETTRYGIEVYTFDVAARFDEIIADATILGFANVTDAAAPGLQPGSGSYDEHRIVAQPNSYLFWDDLHPTAAGHALLAQEALRTILAAHQVPEPASYLLLVGATIAVTAAYRHRGLLKTAIPPADISRSTRRSRAAILASSAAGATWNRGHRD